MIRLIGLMLICASAVLMFPQSILAWPIPDSGQSKCYDNTGEISCPAHSEPFYGQDGNYLINPPFYTKLDSNGNEHA